MSSSQRVNNVVEPLCQCLTAHCTCLTPDVFSETNKTSNNWDTWSLLALWAVTVQSLKGANPPNTHCGYLSCALRVMGIKTKNVKNLFNICDSGYSAMAVHQALNFQRYKTVRIKYLSKTSATSIFSSRPCGLIARVLDLLALQTSAAPPRPLTLGRGAVMC